MKLFVAVKASEADVIRLFMLPKVGYDSHTLSFLMP